jgi:hypothetical protein
MMYHIKSKEKSYNNEMIPDIASSTLHTYNDMNQAILPWGNV